MGTINRNTVRALRPAMFAATGVAVATIAMNVILRLSHMTPRVGDILAFVPSAVAGPDDDTRLAVHRQGQSGCVLDLNVLRRSGGSLILEAQVVAQPDSFQAHWAGTRTSEDAENCGSGADLIVSRLDLDVLAFSAGGYGIGPKVPTPFFTNDIDIAN